jgi:hypothetical protein
MLRSSRIVIRSTSRGIASSSTTLSNPPTHRKRLDIDPSLQALLQDVDMSLMSQKHVNPDMRRELDVLSSGRPEEYDREHDEEEQNDFDQYFGKRKSPAAQFGSQHIGSVVLPHEMQKSIATMVSGA